MFFEMHSPLLIDRLFQLISLGYKQQQIIGIREVIPPLITQDFSDVYIATGLMDTDLCQVIIRCHPVADLRRAAGGPHAPTQFSYSMEFSLVLL